MDAAEYAAWSAWMKSRRGTWTIDPIHNGQDRDLIAFLPNEDDHTKGVFVMVSGSSIEAGKYEDALESVTAGMFYPVWGMSLLGGTKDNRHWSAKPDNAAYTTVIERLGVSFLLGAICDVPVISSPR